MQNEQNESCARAEVSIKKMDGQKQRKLYQPNSQSAWSPYFFSFDAVCRLNPHLFIHSTNQGLGARDYTRSWGKIINMELSVRILVAEDTQVNIVMKQRDHTCQFSQDCPNLTWDNVIFASTLLLSKVSQIG